MIIDGKEVHWLSEDEYKKAKWQLRAQLHGDEGVFKPFRMYGLNVFVDGAIEEIIKLAEDFSLRCRGVDHPISLEMIRNKK